VPALPIIADDSASFPEEVVRQAREWLASTVDSFRDKPPTPQLISLHRPIVTLPDGRPGPINGNVRFDHVAETGLHGFVFQHGTAQVLLRQRGLIVAKFDFVVARHLPDGRMICGPRLRSVETPRGQVIRGPQLKAERVA
jgi:hypothetical protein